MIKKNAKDPSILVRVLEGKKPKKLSDKTILFQGKSHKKGGQDIRFGGRVVNVEGGETAHIDSDGNLQIGGNLKNVFTNKLYKNDFKVIAKKESKLEKKKAKLEEELEFLVPKNKFDLVSMNTKTLNNKIADMELEEIEDEKEFFSITQEATKNIKHAFGIEEFADGGEVPKYADGGKLNKPKWGKDSQKSFENTLGRMSSETEVELLRELILGGKLPKEYGDLTISQMTPKRAMTAAERYVRDKRFEKGGDKVITPKKGSRQGIEILNNILEELRGNKQPTTTETADDTGSKKTDGIRFRGQTVAKNNILKKVEEKAKKYKINSDVMLRLTLAESGGQATVESPAGALGFAQFVPKTAETYGLTREQLTSTKPEDIDAVADAQAKHIKRMLVHFKGDYTKAVMAYNGGAGMFANMSKFSDFRDFARSEGISPDNFNNIDGKTWVKYLEQRRKTRGESPGAYHYETLDYTKRILNEAGKSVLLKDADVDEEGLEYENLEGDEEEDVTGTGGGSGNTTSNSRTSGTDYEGQDEWGFDFGGTESDEETDLPTEGGEVVSQPNEEIEEIEEELEGEVQAQQTQKARKEHKERIRISDIAPELSSLFDTPSYVQGDRYEPTLSQDYRVSFQDRINQNMSAFNRIAQNVGGNPEALSVLAGQLYNSNNAVLSEEFRTNQANINEVMNRNIETMNQAQMQNIGLRDQQYTRQEQAKENTRQNRRNAIRSISDKYNEADRANFTQGLYGQMTDYKVDKDGNIFHKASDRAKQLDVGQNFEPIEEEEEELGFPLKGLVKNIFKRR